MEEIQGRKNQGCGESVAWISASTTRVACTARILVILGHATLVLKALIQATDPRNPDSRDPDSCDPVLVTKILVKL